MNKKLGKYLKNRAIQYNKKFGGNTEDYAMFEEANWIGVVEFLMETITTAESKNNKGKFDVAKKKGKKSRCRQLELKALENMTGEEVTDNLNLDDANEYNELAYGDDE